MYGVQPEYLAHCVEHLFMIQGPPLPFWITPESRYQLEEELAKITMTRSLYPGPHADSQVPVRFRCCDGAVSGQALSGVLYGLLAIDSGRVT